MLISKFSLSKIELTNIFKGLNELILISKMLNENFLVLNGSFITGLEMFGNIFACDIFFIKRRMNHLNLTPFALYGLLYIKLVQLEHIYGACNIRQCTYYTFANHLHTFSFHSLIRPHIVIFHTRRPKYFIFRTRPSYNFNISHMYLKILDNCF